ncbi:MFS transporter [Rossellomorea vietnamensis]|uniref:MFS transporter n=1 Tax=Rossellomorea vietnamensis TaxID=218284 RepID=UPI003CE83652
MLKPLKNINFLLLFVGRLITNIGDSIYAIATMWLVYDLTKDPFFSGIAAALTMAPGILTFLIGPLIDRWSLQKILVRTQVLEFFLISLIPIAYFFDILSVWMILIIMPLASFIEQFVYPAQQAAMPRLLKKDELVTGNSLMSFAYQGTDLAFMGISGLMIVYFGAINLFIVDSITFILAALIFRMIKIPPRSSTDAASESESYENYKKELSEGFKAVKGSFISKFLILIIFANFIFGSIQAILPAYADYRGSSAYLGFYLAALTGGILVGSLGSPLLKKMPIGLTVITGTFLSALLWFSSAVIEHAIFSVILFGLSFIPIGYLNVNIFSILQVSTPENLIGRVFSFIGSITVLSMPAGAIAGGFAAKVFGAETVFILGCLGNLLIAFYWLFSPVLRRYTSITNKDTIENQVSA